MRREDNGEPGDPRAKRREYERLYRQCNRERLRENQARWRAANPDKVREKQNRYYATEKGKATEQRHRAKAVYEETRERYRTQANENNRRWYQRNLDRARLGKIQAAKRRLERLEANGGTCTQEQIAARVAYFGDRCWICKRPWTNMDHVKPVAVGGPSWASNLRPICKSCNERKGTTWPYSV